MWAFSSWGEGGATLRCSVQASHCGGFSCCGAQALGMRASVVVAHRLSCSAACGIFPNRARTHVPCIGRQILNHCTTREAPIMGFLYHVTSLCPGLTPWSSEALITFCPQASISGSWCGLIRGTTCLYRTLKIVGASLVAQWLRICLPVQGTRVRALVWEDPTCRGATRPVSHNYWACVSGPCAPQQERPWQWEARARRWRVAPTCHN